MLHRRRLLWSHGDPPNELDTVHPVGRTSILILSPGFIEPAAYHPLGSVQWKAMAVSQVGGDFGNDLVEVGSHTTSGGATARANLVRIICTSTSGINGCFSKITPVNAPPRISASYNCEQQADGGRKAVARRLGHWLVCCGRHRPTVERAKVHMLLPYAALLIADCFSLPSI